ncbi:putative phospholipase A accessory protein [Yersinia pekkanenii]|uniref:Phospholipase A accessory protein n=2 Tax=Yersinia pekkanenii TaxID=1288385 RepID=A0A0T9ND04_9GAMM|nr:putative phospholipase A accessory protein [Yersinia pekkanenii]CRY64134.1 putative phospholipase A accessory protein [Yersinia pekkanenii]
MPESTLAVRVNRHLRYAIYGVLMPLISFEGQAMTDVNTAFTDPSVMPIADAIIHGDVKQIHQLANEKLLQQQGEQSITLMQWAILNQQPESLAALLQEHADPFQPGMQGDTAWHTAASVQDAHYMQILLEGHLQPTARNSVTLATPLAAAVMAKRETQMTLLLVAGVDPNLADRMGDTPLHLAGKNNAPDLALRLLKAGADPELRNKQGATFQQYLAMTPLNIQSAEMQQKYQQLNVWLRGNKLAEVYQQ